MVMKLETPHNTTILGTVTGISAATTINEKASICFLLCARRVLFSHEFSIV